MTITKSPPRLVLTADGPEFNSTILSNWKDEGYQVTYLPFAQNKKEYINQLNHLADPLESGETYAIVGLLNRFLRLNTFSMAWSTADWCFGSIW